MKEEKNSSIVFNATFVLIMDATTHSIFRLPIERIATLRRFHNFA